MTMLPKNPSPYNLPGCYLAGGALLSVITDAEVADWDFYPKTNEALGDAVHTLIENYSCHCINITDRAITFKSPDVRRKDGLRDIIQICYGGGPYPDASAVFRSFDFSVVMAAYDCDTSEYFFHDDFWPSVAKRQMRFNPSTPWPIASLIRTQKYANKGYHFPKSEMIKLSLTIASKQSPSSWKELSAQIGGYYGVDYSIETDIPYSLEAAIAKIEEISQNLNTNNPIATEIIENYVEESVLDEIFYDEPLYYFNSGNSVVRIAPHSDNISRWYVKGILLPDNIDRIKRYSEKLNPNKIVQEITDNVVITGYKFLEGVDDNWISSGITPTKKLAYGVGQETTCDVAPFLYVFPKITHGYYANKDKRYYVAEFNKNDIRTASEYELTVTKLKVISRYESP